MAPRLALSASPTASASSVEPGMNQGTVFVSARKIASVLIGGKAWVVIPNGGTTGAGGGTAAADPATRTPRGRGALLDHGRAVDEDPLDAFGALEEAALAARQVVHHLGRARRHVRRVEEDEVRRVARREPAPAADTVALGGDAGQEPHRLLQPERAQLPHPVAEEIGREALVAERVDVGGGVQGREQG